MTALIFSMVLTFLFFRTGQGKLLLPAGAVLYTAGCLGRAYYAVGIQIPLLRQLYTWPGYLTFSRFFFTGFPYFSAGYPIFLIRNRTGKRKNSFFILLFVFCLTVWGETVFLLRMGWAYSLIAAFGSYSLRPHPSSCASASLWKTAEGPALYAGRSHALPIIPTCFSSH
jgi:hypothetical protein